MLDTVKKTRKIITNNNFKYTPELLNELMSGYKEIADIKTLDLITENAISEYINKVPPLNCGKVNNDKYDLITIMRAIQVSKMDLPIYIEDKDERLKNPDITKLTSMVCRLTNYNEDVYYVSLYLNMFIKLYKVYGGDKKSVYEHIKSYMNNVLGYRELAPFYIPNTIDIDAFEALTIIICSLLLNDNMVDIINGVKKFGNNNLELLTHEFLELLNFVKN